MAYGRCFPRWREAAGDTWTAYVRHEFVERLADGSLPRECYLHYLVQDYLFLVHFARAWALGAAKADTLEEMRACAATVSALVDEEMRLHVETCAAEGIDRAALEGAEERAGNLAYTRYVLEAGYSGDFLDLLAALAPCVFGYGEIGARLSASPHHERYADWIAMYGGESYQQVCRDVGALVDGAVARRLGETALDSPRWTRLCERFGTATRLEVGFWEMGLQP